MKHEDAVRGVDVAQRAVRAAALDDDAGVLAAVNSATPTELAYAVASLVSMVKEATLIACRGDKAVASLTLMSAADNVEDGVAVMVDVILDDEVRRLVGGL